KSFNMSTVKMHFFPDYPPTIQYIGTTDNYNTQTGELQHRQVKRRYAKSGKVKYISSIADQEARERFVAGMRRRMEKALVPAEGDPAPSRRRKAKKSDDDLPFTDPKAHYHVAELSRESVDIAAWMRDHEDDPALKGFRSSLIDHILARVLDLPENHDWTFTDADRNTIRLKENKMHFHQVLRVNYNTYDVRREQDSMNPRTHADVMVLSSDDPTDPSFQPYWYARILSIFHVLYQHAPPDSNPTEYRRMDITWVRWMVQDPGVPSPWTTRRLPRVGPIDLDEPDALGFINPNDIVRGVHLMPDFVSGAADDLPTPSLAREAVEWKKYRVNMHADRDHFMRFRGGGIGHASTRHLNKILRADAHAVTQQHDPSSPGRQSGEDLDTGTDNEDEDPSTNNNDEDPSTDSDDEDDAI
ncbi:hypothetical protein FA95DRAFT_1470638, partial [Auriscalpium vulgare]